MLASINGALCLVNSDPCITGPQVTFEAGMYPDLHPCTHICPELWRIMRQWTSILAVPFGGLQANKVKQLAMAVNYNKPDRWKEDTALSVDMYNDWFIRFAPEAFRATREQTTRKVQQTFAATRNLTDVGVELLRANPSVLPTLRMSTCPPLARDRLIGLAGVSSNLVEKMETENRLPPRMGQPELDRDLRKIGAIIVRLADPGLFVWFGREKGPTEKELYRAATIVATLVRGRGHPISETRKQKSSCCHSGCFRERYGPDLWKARNCQMTNPAPLLFANVPFSRKSGRSINAVDACDAEMVGREFHCLMKPNLPAISRM